MPLAVAAAVALAAMVGPGLAAAAEFDLHQVSGAPYTVDSVCGSEGLDGEVSLGVDPSTGRMVAAWVQDIEGLSNPALTTLTAVTASSSDGVDWTGASSPPGVMVCDVPPGPNDVVTDPSVSVGPDGRWYLGRLGEVRVPGTPLPLPSGIYVSTSTTGSTWSYPPVAMLDNLQDDFDTVVADPDIAGRAYATWTNFPSTASSPSRSQILFSKTTNGGASFSGPTPVHRAPSGYVDDAARLVVLGDGTLLTVFAELTTETFTSGVGPFTLYATRSTDGGDSWSAPVDVQSGSYSNVADPATGEIYEAYCCLESLTAGAGNSAYLTWNTNQVGGGGSIHIASSSDGGRSWTATSPLERSAQTFTPTVAAGGGTIAVTWYDFAGEQPADQARPTTLWVARSKDGGASWTVDRLAGPFDLAAATPPGAANYLGDTQGLVAIDGGFEAAFTAAKPLATDGPTDIFRAFIPGLPADADPPAPPPTPACDHPMVGTPHSDVLRGTRRSDRIRARDGNDVAAGRQAGDCIRGDRGADLLRGGRGGDLIVTGDGRDRVAAGPGRDSIRSRDKAIDRIKCGSGRDVALASADDQVAADCESIQRP